MPTFIDPSQLDPLPQGATQISEAQLDPVQEQPGSIEALGRGLLQGASMGWSDEIGAAIESLFTDKSYDQARDEARANNAAAKAAHPFLYGAGEFGGGIADSFIPGLNVAKGASLGKAALSLGAQGAIAGLGGTEHNLVGPGADIGGALSDTALSAGIGAGIGAAAHGIGSLVGSAPEQAAADRMSAVAQGTGLKGSATVTAKKMLARDPQAIDDALTERFTTDAVNGKPKTISLSDIMKAPAKEVTPILEQRMDQVGEQLDPIYKAFDSKEGGMSLLNFVNHVDDTVAELAKTPLNEKYIEALNDVKNSALKSWAPELADKVAANAKGAAAGLDNPVFSKLEDVTVPYQDFRAMVTRLQKRGSNVINPLNPGEATQLKADLAQNLRDFLNADLERLADNHPDLADAASKIQDINREYSALATIHKAVEQRGWKEAVGNTTAKGHLASGIGAAVGAVAGGAIPVPGVGHAVGAAIGAGVGQGAQRAISGSREAATRALAAAHGKLAALAQAAANGDTAAGNLLAAIHASPEITARFAALHSAGAGR